MGHLEQCHAIKQLEHTLLRELATHLLTFRQGKVQSCRAISR